MLKLITAATALTVLVACDSEGIDRADVAAVSPNVSNNGSVTFNNDDTDGTASVESSDEPETENATTTETDTGTATATPVVNNDTASDADDTDADASSNTQISDDAGSSTSDGGQISDDAASSTSDGGQISNDDSTPDPVVVDAGSFSSGIDGDVLRVSSLVAGGTPESICTTLSDQDNFSNIQVGDFILHNNAWRPFRAFPDYEWEQCINTNVNGAVAGWTYDWGPGQAGLNGAATASGDFFVRSYPELIFGTKDEFRTSAPTSVTGLPVMISEMPTFRIDYSYDGPQFGDSRAVDASNNSRFPNGTTISGERNVAVESFFYETDANGNCSADTVTRTGGSNHTYEVMVWLDAGAERLPAGPNNFVADLNLRGADYKVYTKDSDERYIAFVAQNPQTTGTIYLNDFIDWARENAHVVTERFGALSDSVQIQDDWCMANILVGTEIFWGAGNMDIYDWTITQSN